MTGFTDAGVAKYTVLTGKRADGLLSVRADPTAALGIATKQYVDARAPAPAIVSTLVDAATVTMDMALSLDFAWMLGGVGRTFANPNNLRVGQRGMIYLTQDGTGSRTITRPRGVTPNNS